MDLSLLPANPYKRSIIQQLNSSLQHAEALYASVCFWSIGPGVVSHDLERVLAQPGSFCIADIHSPTNVDKLAQFYELGVTKLYLFFKEIQPKKLDAYLQRHLLHTKMLLIDLPDNKAELWVGSHNFTKQALKGVNREATLVLPCFKDDVLYTQAQRYFSSILQDPDCRQFDPNLLDTYKELQGLPKDEVESGPYFMPLAWDSNEMTTLAQHLILLAGADAQELNQFKLIDNDKNQLAIRAHDLAGGPVRYFSAALHMQGSIFPDDPGSYDIRLGQRHLAVRNGTQLPFVAPLEEEHSRETLRKFRYHVSIRILDELPQDLQFADDKAPAEAKWRADEETNKMLAQAGMRTDYYGADRPLYRAVQIAAPIQWDSTLHDVAPFDANNRVAPSPAADDISNSREPYVSTTPDNATRVSRWLERARQRRYRSAPTEPKGLHVEFFHQHAQKHLPSAFASLDEEFLPANLPALRADFEQPLREVYYREDAQQLQAPDSTQGPQVRKLLKRYRLR
ncbi:phospholipase D-like domain-containing protein [Hymenobacter lucidus]|uniref:Phospholipase D family protein n=1 Tax=Hymenobacter lucidus TaxID=2880930 RepID=A0ABS8AZ32_9BACT|nr:phospholipase D-like domain-containing protein [Hymenobacter lucidus]MCB2411048.1 phospholipase D family protein [Hymenobacter lucidus]